MRLREIPHDVEILVAEIADIPHVPVQDEAGQRQGLALQLRVGLFEVVQIKMGVPQRVNEFASPCRFPTLS